MEILKWLSFIVLFSVSLSFSTESDETTFESSTSQSAFTFESTIGISTPETTFNYQSIDEDSTSESTFNYQSTGDDSTSESTFDYQLFDSTTIEGTFDYLSIFEISDLKSSPDYFQSVLKDYASENDYESSIKNLLYPPDDRDCPLHEHWEFCTGHCQRNCSNWSKALICPDICVQGCLCDWGLTRGPEGNCIPVSECPPIENEEPMRINVQYKCPRNEHFSLCEGCQKNCSNYDEEIPCESICSPGCICDEGFVRGGSGKCIPIRKCRNPSMKSTIQSKNPRNRFCRRNEHFSACNGLPLCQKSCSNYNESTICPLICVPGCVCDEGYVIGPAGECIPLEECPYERKPTSLKVKQEECSANEYYDTCGSACPRSCLTYQEVFPFCTDEQCVTGCFCLPGYVRGPDGICIRPVDCFESAYEKSKRTNSKIMNLFFEAVKQELSALPSTVSEDVYPVTISPSEDECPDEPSCVRKCRMTGHDYGMCLGIREKECVCF